MIKIIGTIYPDKKLGNKVIWYDERIGSVDKKEKNKGKNKG